MMLSPSTQEGGFSQPSCFLWLVSLVTARALLGRYRLDRGFLDGFEDLLDTLRVKRRVVMERNHHPASTLCVDPMTALGPQPNEAGFQQHRFGIRRS